MTHPQAPQHLLLTGGTGFFGRALLRYWQCAGLSAHRPWRVTLVSRNPVQFRQAHPGLCANPWLELVAGDIHLPESLPQGRTFSHVIHAAADSTLGPQLSPLQRFDQIVQGTRHVLDVAVRSGARRFLLTSSGAVYGQPPAGAVGVPESWMGMPDPMDSRNAYGVAKRAAEHLCALYAQATGLEVVVARCFSFVGPDLPLDVHFAIGNFIRDALWAERIVVGGDGTPVRSYLDQTDLADWLMQLLVRGAPGHAYNVGSDEAISIEALAQLVRETLAPHKPVHVLGTPVSNAAQRSVYVPDIHKIRSELGVAMTVPLRQSILATAQAARSA